MRNFSIFLLVIVSTCAFSQMKLNNALKSRMYENLLQGQYFDVLVQGDVQKLEENQQALGIKVKYHAGNIACVNLDVNAISKLVATNYVKYIEYIEPRKKPLNDTMVVRNRIKPVKIGASPLPMPYNGNGMIVGIIDSGIDFSHPDFKDSLGNTRIDFIWDQAVATPTVSPMPFNYGQEWTAAQINAGVCTHDDTPYWGHGTGVSGTAAGNGLGNGTHQGCASRARIIVVALDFNKAGPTIPDAVQYIITKATAAGKPFVINASVGDYYGSHDATDAEAKMIEAMITAAPGRAMAAAAGNAGNVKFHTQNMVVPTDTNFTWLQNTSGNLYYWLYADTLNIKNVKYSIGVNRDTTFIDLGNIGFKNYNYGFTVKTDTIFYGGNRIGRVQSSASINTYGVYELFIKIIPDTMNYLWRIESTGTGKFDAWNFNFVSTNLPSTSLYPKITKYTMPDTLQTIVSSFQCSDELLTVANYANLKQYYDVNNTLQTNPETAGDIVPSSSIGPTRDGRIKPDIAASGNGIFSCIVLSMAPNIIANYPFAVAQGSLHVGVGGTSAASPVVAGLATLYMEAFPSSTNQQVRQKIINCTYSDGFTGTLPNNQWGYGKLDGLSTFTCSVLGLNSVSLDDFSDVYPNPFVAQTKLSFKSDVSGEVFIYNALGKLILRDKINSKEYLVEKNKLGAEGIYFVNVVGKDRTYNYKIIAQ